MFSQELNGYSKGEVDLYIKKLKASYEESLLEAKLRALESEKKVHDMKSKIKEMDIKENNIRSALEAIERATKMQQEGAKNLYSLKLEQINLAFSKIDELVAELQSFDEVINNPRVKLLILDLQNMTETSRQGHSSFLVNSQNSTDNFRNLLDKMQTVKKHSGTSPVKQTVVERREVKVVKADSGQSQIKPITGTMLENDDEYSSPLEKFFNSKSPDDNNKLYGNVKLQANAFDLKEAVNPKSDLEDIMKSFDFFNDSNPDDEEKRRRALQKEIDDDDMNN